MRSFTTLSENTVSMHALTDRLSTYQLALNVLHPLFPSLSAFLPLRLWNKASSLARLFIVSDVTIFDNALEYAEADHDLWSMQCELRGTLPSFSSLGFRTPYITDTMAVLVHTALLRRLDSRSPITSGEMPPLLDLHPRSRGQSLLALQRRALLASMNHGSCTNEPMDSNS